MSTISTGWNSGLKLFNGLKVFFSINPIPLMFGTYGSDATYNEIFQEKLKELGEKRFIKVDAHSKAYITEGICDVYCKVHADYEKHIVNVLEEAEINNKTKFPIYIELKECLLTDSRQGDLTLNILPKL